VFTRQQHLCGRDIRILDSSRGTAMPHLGCTKLELPFFSSIAHCHRADIFESGFVCEVFRESSSLALVTVSPGLHEMHDSIGARSKSPPLLHYAGQLYAVLACIIHEAA
jgi:hypothetical protein